MKNIASLVLMSLSGAVLAVLMGCGTKKEEAAAEETAMPQVCTYSFAEDSTKLTWTAYKLTEKVGVSGTFDSIQVQGQKESQQPLEVVDQLVFVINTETTNSNSPDRDKKIADKYFGIMKNAGQIKGFVKSFGEGGKAVIALDVNGVQKDLEFSYSLSGEVLTLEGVMEMGDWELQESLSSLNKVCDLLHTGKDGLSKLWPDVKIEVRTVLSKSCS